MEFKTTTALQNYIYYMPQNRDPAGLLLLAGRGVAGRGVVWRGVAWRGGLGSKSCRAGGMRLIASRDKVRYQLVSEVALEPIRP